MTQPNILVFECLAFGAPQWNEAGEAVRFGELLAGALSTEIGASNACSVSALEARGSYGWEFIITHGASRIWCLLQRADAWLLITEPRRALADRRKHESFVADHAFVCAAIDAAVQRLPGVSGMRWLTLEEFHAAR